MPLFCAACRSVVDPEDEDDYFPCDECPKVYCGGCFDKHLVTDDETYILEYNICLECQARL